MYDLWNNVMLEESGLLFPSLAENSIFALMYIPSFLMACGRMHVGAGNDDGQAVVVVKRDSVLQDWASVRTQLAIPTLKQSAK